MPQSRCPISLGLLRFFFYSLLAALLLAQGGSTFKVASTGLVAEAVGNDFQAEDKPGMLTYTCPPVAGAQENRITLRLNGSDLELKDSQTGKILGAQPLAVTRGILVRGADGDARDSLTVDFSGGMFALPNGIYYDGGTGGFDTLRIEGGSFSSEYHLFKGPSDGTICLDGTPIVYSNLEPVQDTVAAANFLISATAGLDQIVIEDGPVVSTFQTTRVRSANGTFEQIDFANKTTVTIAGAGGGDTVTINNSNPAVGLAKLLITGVATVSQTGPAEFPSLGITATGAITLTDLNNFISNFEAQTDNGGINLVNNLALTIGSVDATLTGLRVTGSGDIQITNFGAINLADTDGAAVIQGGTVSSNVSLFANAIGVDITSTVDRDLVSAPRGNITFQAGRDISLGTGGINFDNDVRANGSITFFAGRDIVVDGFADVSSDDFGQNTGAGVLATADHDIILANVTGSDASIGASGTGAANVGLITGTDRFLTVNAGTPAAIFSSSGNVTITADRVTIDPASGITAASPRSVRIQTKTAGRQINLGSTTDAAANTLELSDAELDRIFTGTIFLGMADTGAISLTNTISPLTATTLSLQTSAGINQAASSVTVGTLQMQASGNITLNQANDVDTLSATNALLNASIQFHDVDGLTLAGITTNGGPVTIVTDGGTMVIGTGSPNTGISTGAAGNIVRLQATTGGLSQTPQGAITSDLLGIRAAGPVVLSTAANDNDALTINTTGLVEYNDIGNVTISAVAASGLFSSLTVGISSGNNNINLHTGINLLLNDAVAGPASIDAGLGDVRILAGGTVNQINADDRMVGNEVGIIAGASVTLNSANNDADFLAITTPHLVFFKDIDDLTVSAVAAGGGAGFTGVTGVTGDSTELESGATFSVVQPVHANLSNHIIVNNGSTLTSQSNISGSNINLRADSQDFQASSTITAPAGSVNFVPNSGGVNANIGSVGAGFSFSQTELNTITTPILRIFASMHINLSQSVTLAPGQVPTFRLETPFGAIIDATAGEQPDLTVNNLLLSANTGIGSANDIDCRVNNLIYLNTGGAVQISNVGPLNFNAVDGSTSSSNLGTTTSLTAASPVVISTPIGSSGDLTITAGEQAGAGDDITVNNTVSSTAGNVTLQAGDNVDVLNGTVNSSGTTSLVLGFGDVDGIANGTIRRSVNGSSVVANGGAANNALLLDFGNGAVLPNGLTYNAGGGTNSLTVDDTAGGSSHNYTVTTTTVVRDSSTITYSNVQTLTVNGGGGTDTLTGPNSANTWNITGSNQGNITGLLNSFTGIENLVGGSSADSFVFSNAATVAGTINGGAGTDTIDYAAYTTPVAVNLGSNVSSLTASLGSEQEVPATSSTGTGTATLTFNSATKTFDISLTVSNITPAEVIGFHIHRAAFGINGPIIVDFVPGGVPIAPLVPAGSGFTFNATGVALPPGHEAAFLGGITYVNVHTPTFPAGAIRGQVFPAALFVAASGTATGSAGISSIENATGGTGADSLVGDLSANSLQGNGGNDTIVGSRGNDTMTGTAGSDTMVWSNGDGTDIMDGNADGDLVQVNGALAADDNFSIAAGVGGRVDFDRISPAPFSLDIGTVETLIVNGLTGNDTFTLGALAGITDLTLLNLNGLDGNETFNVKASPTATISVNGGFPTTPTGDSLIYDAEGRIFSGDTTPPDGQIVSPGVQNVNFQQLESVNVTGAAADLSITKSDSPDPVTAGTNLTYTLTVSNAGPGDAANVSVSDALPANTTFVSATQNSGPSFTLTTPPVGGTGTVTATAANFAAGATATFTLTVNVNASTANGATITNTATISSANTDPNPANNSDTETTTVNTLADLSVTKTDFPDPVTPGDNLTYTITLTNNGPSDAQNVLFTDVVPANTTFVSFTAQAGWTSTTPPAGGTGTITSANPSVPAGSVSTFLLVVKVNNNPSTATITNTATVSSATTDPIPANNSATTTTSLPALVINDVAVTEGNSGSVNAVFTVSLTGPNAGAVTVDFFTANGSATEPSDFTAVNGTVTFLPGQTSRTITVPVNGDTVPEGDETFFVNLTNASNSPIGDNQGMGTIIDDDPGGTMQFNAATFNVNENASSATVTVNRTGSTLGTVTVNFATSNGTATAGSDYGTSSGTLTFGPGVTSQQFTVPIIDDTTSEGTESVNLTLSGPTGGGTLGTQNTAVLLILDNEAPPANSVNIYAVTVTNNLLTFNSAAPETILSTVPITGLQSGETMLSIDFRPASGQLFGLGSTSRLYTINTTTGVATAVAGPFSPALSGSDFGSDFNPTVDRLRVVADSDQNLRLNPTNGTVAGADTALSYASGDANFGANPNVVGAAYTNSFAGSTTTTLYGIDSNLDTLVLQGSVNGAPVSPNTGLLTTVGTLGVNTNGLVGFDIQGSTNRGLASLSTPGDSSSKLYDLNLTSGAASLIGTIGGSDLIRDVAVAAGTIEFTSATATVAENGGSVTLTITRTGNTSIPATVSFASSNGTATQIGDFTIALGTLQFAAGETSKSINIPIIDDAYVEGSETFTVTLSAASNDFAISGNTSTTVTITDNDSVAPTTNPIDDAQFFVRQQYLDFLNREPEAGGLTFWTGQITACGSDAACVNRRRVEVSAAFFGSPEFQETGGLVHRMYKAGLNRQPNYLEFMRDRGSLPVGPGLEAAKVALFNSFVLRLDFLALFPTSLTPAQYVDGLNANTGNSLTPAQRDALVAGLTNGTETRATVLRKVSENAVFTQQQTNPAFVLMEYFGYLRRDADPGGQAFWLNILNNSGNFRGMVCAFITSPEYQDRFSPIRTRTDALCAGL